MRQVKARARRLAVQPAIWLGKLGLRPNQLTVGGSVLTGLVGVLAAQGWFVAAAICLWLFSLTDTLDGALARETGQVTVFGAFLDSVCDRYAEAAVFLGLVWWYQSTGDGPGIVLAYLALVGSLMVSYARARAEGVGVEGNDVGWLQRPERIIALGLGFLGGAAQPWVLRLVLGVLVVLTTVTVWQRMRHVAHATQISPPP